MPLCTLEEIFTSPWGIVEHRRDDIQRSGFGGFDRILEEEIARQFASTEEVAGVMECHPSTARRWLRDWNPRYIIRQAKVLYFWPDAMEVIEHRKRSKTKTA